MIVKVGGHQYALEQLNQFANGKVLCYDVVNCRDRFGHLTGVKFSRKPKWRKFYPDAVTIDLPEFNRLWRKSIGSCEWVNR